MDGRQLSRLEHSSSPGAAGRIKAVAFGALPDGRLVLATGGVWMPIHLWTITTHTKPRP